MLSASTDLPWYEHPAIQTLTSELDLQHTCGYITLINTGCPYSILTKTCKQQTSPTNGLTGDVEAEVLASEIDSLNIGQQSQVQENDKNESTPTKADSSKLVLDLNYSPTCLEDKWSLLEVSYGIPLFNASLNHRVCESIKSQNLYTEER